MPQAGAWAHLLRHAGWYIALLAMVLYLPTLWFGYTMDDLPIVRDNERIRSLAHPAELLLTDYWHLTDFHSVEYRPVTIASFALEHALWGGRAAGYHLGNVLLFALCCGLFWRLLSRLLGAGALAAGAALLFALHPLHVEVVAGLVGRSELLMSLFCLLGLLAARGLIGEQPSGLRRAGLLAGVFGCGLLSMGAKEHGALLPVLICALALLPLDGDGGDVKLAGEVQWRAAAARWRAAAGAVGACMLALGCYFVARHHVLGAWLKPAAVNIRSIENPLAGLPAGARLMTALSVIMRGIGLLVCPLWQSPDYSPQVIPLVRDFSDPLALAGLLFVALAAGSVWWLRRRPAAWLGLVWMLASWLIASNLVIVIGTIFGERLLFLPSFGACLLLGSALLALARLQRGGELKFFAAAVGLFAVLFAGEALAYMPAWRDNPALFAYGARHVPRSARLQLFHARMLADAGQWAEAAAPVERAVELYGDYGEAHLLQAQVYLHTGRTQEAEAILAQLHLLDPAQPQVLNELANLYISRGKLEEAFRVLNQGYLAAPGSALNAYRLGMFLADHGHAAEARPLLEQAYGRLPDADRELIDKRLAGVHGKRKE